MKIGVLRQITQIQKLSLAELRDRWKEYFGTEPPAYGRSTLIRRLAYRVQELVDGGISEVTRAKLRDHLGAEANRVGCLKRRKANRDGPVVGTCLVRTWHDHRHEVTVVHGGFEYGGRKYRSLSAIANQITGTRWNGPAFFGLRRKNDGQ